MIPRLENSFLCSFKGLEKWLFWITGELNREEWFHYEIMIHDVQSFLRRVLAALRFDFGRAVIPCIVILNIWDQRVPSRAKNERNAFQRGKKKQGWLAKTNDARVFPASLAWLPCFSLRSDCLPCIFVSLYLVVRAKISFSLSRHIVILQVVTHRCAYYRAWPTCLRKKIKVLQVCGILCVWLVSRVYRRSRKRC